VQVTPGKLPSVASGKNENLLVADTAAVLIVKRADGSGATNDSTETENPKQRETARVLDQREAIEAPLKM
jgi:hypothetical protein